MALSGPVAFTQFSVWALKPGDWGTCHGGASGLGLVTALVAKALGARVITNLTQGLEAEMLQTRGFDAVLNTRRRWVRRIRSASSPPGKELRSRSTTRHRRRCSPR